MSENTKPNSGSLVGKKRLARDDNVKKMQRKKQNEEQIPAKGASLPSFVGVNGMTT